VISSAASRPLDTSPDPSVPSASMPRLEVFLSHSTVDREHVELVSRQIEALGIDVYLAEHDPKPGTSIAHKVEEALKRCAAVVVLITTTSVNSAYVQQEIGFARAHGKTIVPIIEKSVDKSRLGMLTEVEWLELDLSAPAEAMAKVTASLQPLVFAQLPPVNVSVSITPAQPDLVGAFLLVGLGLLLGLLIASIALGGAGSSGSGSS
jgi:TIR domain